jgi:hypothetical protein
VTQCRLDDRPRLADRLRRSGEVHDQRTAADARDAAREDAERRVLARVGPDRLGVPRRLALDHVARRLRRDVVGREPRPAGREDEPDAVVVSEPAQPGGDRLAVVGDCLVHDLEPGALAARHELRPGHVLTLAARERARDGQDRRFHAEERIDDAASSRDFTVPARFKHAMARFLPAMLAVLVLAPGADAAPWQKQRLAGGYTYGAPEIATNSRGDVVAAASTDHVWVGVKPRGSARFSEFATPGSAGGVSPGVAVGKGGLVTIAWNDLEDLERRVVRFDIGGKRPRRSELVSLPGEEVSLAAGPVPVAMSDRGTVATAWRSGDFMMVARAWRGQGFEEPIPVAYEAARNIGLSFDTDDRLTVTWTVGNEGSELRSVTLPAHGRDARPITMADFLAPEGNEFSNLSVRQDASGDRLLVWGRGDGLVRAGRAEPGGPLVEVQELEPGELQFESSEPELAVSRLGSAIAAWPSASPDRDLHPVRVTLSTPEQPFAAPTTVARDGREHAVAIGRGERAVAAWSTATGKLKVLALRPGSDPAEAPAVRRKLTHTPGPIAVAMDAERVAYVIVASGAGTRIYWRRLTWP